MVLFDGFGGLLLIGLWVFCFIDVLLTPEPACRNLPKLAWVFIVLLLSVIGSILWLVAGRPWNAVPSRPRAAGARARAPVRATNPDDDEEFLASLKLRADEQRRRAREQRDGDSRDGEID